MPSFEGNLLIQRHQVTSLETRNSRLSYGEDPESLSHLGLVYHRVLTDGRTDRQTDRIPTANTRLSSAWRHRFVCINWIRTKQHNIKSFISFIFFYFCKLYFISYITTGSTWIPAFKHFCEEFSLQVWDYVHYCRQTNFGHSLLTNFGCLRFRKKQT